MESFSSASVAYLHYLSFMVCFGALIFERNSIKTDPSRQETISIVVADVVYGIAGIILLTSGIFRVIKYGQGSDFYTENPVFWSKVIIFALIGSLSIYPTVTYLRWSMPLIKGDLPSISLNLVKRLKLIINIELIGFSLIPFFATLMARGIGLN